MSHTQAITDGIQNAHNRIIMYKEQQNKTLQQINIHSPTFQVHANFAYSDHGGGGVDFLKPVH